MTVGLRVVVGIVNCVVLAIAGFLAILSLGLFAGAFNDYKNTYGEFYDDYCFLFVDQELEFGSNGVCNFIVAVDVIVLLLILVSGVAMVMTFFVVKWSLVIQLVAINATSFSGVFTFITAFISADGIRKTCSETPPGDKCSADTYKYNTIVGATVISWIELSVLCCSIGAAAVGLYVQKKS